MTKQSDSMISNHCFKLEPPILLLSDPLLSLGKLELKSAIAGFASELLDWDSEALGLVQIFIWPSRQAVTTDSCVNIRPESGSV